MGLDQTWEHKAGEKTKGPGIQNKLKPRTFVLLFNNYPTRWTPHFLD